MKRLLLALAAALWAPPAAAQQPPSPPAASGPRQIWSQSETQVVAVTARTAFPRVAGPISFVGATEFSHKGEGIDVAFQYRSADNKVIGTVYAYLPGLSHSGLAAYATDQGIRANSNSPVRSTRSMVVAAGGVAGAAIRTDYENYMGGHSSSAAFIKAGRWTIKLRVSAPEARRAEVTAAMDLLLAGIRFGAQNPPHEATPLRIDDCAGAGGEDAKPLPESAEATAARAFLATFDGGGNEAVKLDGTREDLPSRVPPALCLSTRITRDNQKGYVPVLRAADGSARSVDGRTRLVAIVSDSGMWLEVVHARNLGAYIALFHAIGSTQMLGSYDAVPSDRQIAAWLSDAPNEGNRIRASVVFRPDQGPQLILPAPPAWPAPQT